MLFLLFYLGLEFSLGRLIKAGRLIAGGGTIYIALNFGLGLGFAWLMSWPLREMLVTAGITTISSSANWRLAAAAMIVVMLLALRKKREEAFHEE